MAAKPRMIIVGAGNLAFALAPALRGAGYSIEAIVSRPHSGSLKNTRWLAKGVGTQAVVELPPDLRASVIWFCVPDSEIRNAAKELADQIAWKGRLAFHSSGALTSDELSDLRDKDASVASVHPMMTFVRGRSSTQGQPSLSGVPFAVEGDRDAVRVARQIVRNLGGQPFPIRKSDKPAYHAWGTFASPLLTALFATSEQVASLAGIDRKAAKRRMIPMLRQTLENYVALDIGNAFSGPIIRGDVETVKKHLRVLSKASEARAVYLALASAALRYLPAKNQDGLRKVLRSVRSVRGEAGDR